MARRIPAILVATALAVSFWPSAGRAAGYGTFAECIRESGAVMYETSWCPMCRRQRDLFRGYSNRLRTFKCDVAGDRKRTKATCKRLGIEGYPTWIFGDGSMRTGVQSAENLARGTGCAVPD